MSDDGRALVTKTSFRYLQTLYNLGPAPEPNPTIFWSTRLPEGFKRFCVQASVKQLSISGSTRTTCVKGNFGKTKLVDWQQEAPATGRGDVRLERVATLNVDRSTPYSATRR